MSGKKYSSFRVVPSAAQARSQLLAQIDGCRGVITGIEQQIGKALDNGSEGVRLHFADQALAAQNFRERLRDEAARTVSWRSSQDLAVLNQGHSHLQSLLAEGRQAYVNLLDAFNNRAPRLRHERRSRLAALTGSFHSLRTMIGQWLGKSQVEALERQLDEVRRTIEADDFVASSRLLDAFHVSLTQAREQAAQREAELIRTEQVRNLLALRREVESLDEGLRQRLEATSAGLRTTFADEIEQGRRWLESVVPARAACPSEPAAAGAATLTAAAEQLQNVLSAGQTVSATIERALTEDAAQLRSLAEARLSALSVLYSGNIEQLAHWFDAPAIADLRAAIDAAQQTFLAERFRDLEEPCQKLEQTLRTMITQAQEQGEKHERRLYLLQSLRESCQQLGFEEVEAPRLESEGDYRSRYRLSVDTFDHGVVTFHLALDSIHADSCISETHCFDEFDKLSKQLIDRFGIQTEFVMAETRTRPIGEVWTAIDEPRAGSRQQQVESRS